MIPFREDNKTKATCVMNYIIGTSLDFGLFSEEI